MKKYKKYLTEYLKENDLKIEDGKNFNITIQVGNSDKEQNIDNEYEELFNDDKESTGKNNFFYEDSLEDLYKIEKSIEQVLASCECFEEIQTFNSVINPNTEVLYITLTTKTDNLGILEKFYQALIEYNKNYNEITDFNFEIENRPEIKMGSDKVCGRNKNVKVIKVFKKGNKNGRE